VLRAALAPPALAALAALSLLGPRPAVALQEPAPPADEPSPLEQARRARAEAGSGAEGAQAPVLGPDGRPLMPGELPPGTSPAARALWERLLAATLAPAPVRSFDLRFYLVHRREGPGTNTTQARIRFLWPAFVRASLQSGREHVRGPEGDWLIDHEERVRLIGREGAEDKKQIDETISIARNFLALSDPLSLRLAELAALAGPPEGLPPALVGRARELDWLALTSPDFRLYRSAERPAGAPPPLYRALLGIDRIAGQAELAWIAEAGAPGSLASSALLVHLQHHERRSGFLVPMRLAVYEISELGLPRAFREEPSSELTLKQDGVDLRATLAPADFLP
jgi:hypothetical protein